ncbi:unnamed protein product [Rhizophagus irregularis]|uniref:Ion transport domain-containing protein n=1 Tax=Rhizophagus irregularis TaxID=588596 RepID=A0A915YSF3_9GLOM|nr:unnamed protein product [Rhizophagus irregularis]
MEDKQRNNTFKSVVNYFKYRDEINEIDINYEKDDITTNKEVYQIELCQDGRFAATFDTANLRIKILQNTDYRPFIFNKKKNNLRNENDVEGSVEIDKTIAYFKINDDFSIEKLYDHNPPIFDDNKVEKETKKDNFRWSFDISNMYEKNDKCFVFVAISRINIDEDMKGTNKNDNGKSSYEREQLTQKIFKCPPSPNENDSVLNIPGSGTTQPESKKGIAIYRIELNRSYIISAVTCHYSNKISGLCKFIEVSSEEDSNKDYLSKYDYSELRRFIILNFRGIYNIEFDDNFDFLKLTEKFEYPQNIKIVLDNWLKFSGFADCTNRLLSCIYDKYFLVTRFNNGVQSLEVYNLAKMEHEVNARFVENIVNESYDYFFSVSGLQICFTQVNIVKLFLIENGLEIASKKFEELERIYLLEFIDSDKKLLIIGKGQGLKKGEDQKNEGLKVGKDLEEGKDQESNKDKEDKKVLKFIIWDLYNTGEHELVKLYDFPITKTNMDDIYTRLAITSGNILQIDDYGKISSVLKKFEKEINKKKLDKAAGPKVPNLKKIFGKLNGKDDENHTIHYDEKVNFKQIVNDREPWLPGGSKRTSYCLYYNEEGTKTETLQLIVSRSTVQIWHQINDDSKNKDELPNKGEAFLEYIWSNCIPVKQEREITRLRIEKFEYGPNYGSKSKEYDFYLKVYWFESNDSSKPEEHTKMTEHEIIKKENDEIDEIEDKIKKINENKDINEADKEKKSQEIINSCVKIKLRKKVIKGKDVIKKSHAARHACKALEHIRKRYKSKSDADNYKYKRLTNYIEHIIWRFAKYEPEKFRLLDVRYNLMKSLILADCDRLIKFILFGYEETAKNKIDYRHVPSNKLWPGKKFLKDDDFNFGGERDHELKIPENNMELAIYYCRGRELKDAIIVAYLLEYYSRNPTNCVGWMCTVSKAIPLLFENKYDDFARKLFIRCFADQGHFSDEIITEGYLESLNHSDIKLRAFTPMVKLMSDKPKWYNRIWDTFKDFDSIFEESKNFETSLLALRVVPFPGFSVDNIPRERMKFTLTKFIFNILSLFVPRFYRILRNDIMKLSPFSRMVLFSWAYLDHSTIINHYFLFALIVVFYYLATYQVITESLQFNYRGFKKYLSEIYNIIDLISIIVAVTIMSTMVKNFQFFDGFGNVKETDPSLVVLISFSIFLLWIELILNLRLMPVIGIYVYHVIIIFKTIFPFILFILIIIFAFAHTMFVLLRNPIGIKTKDSTYSGVATNSLTNETLDIKLKSDFDPMSSDSNPFTSFSEAMMATYFWINGDWVQRDEFDYWAVDVFTLIASIFLVIVLQNMLIAYMSNAYEDVTARSRQILLRLQVGFIKDYVALQHLHFSEPEPEPKHIYYSSQADYFEEWYNTKSDNDKGPIYKSFEINSTLTLSSIFIKKDYDKYSILAYDDNNIKMIIEDYIKLVSDNTEDLVKRVIDSEEFEDMKIDLDHILEKLKKKIYKL